MGVKNSCGIKKENVGRDHRNVFVSTQEDEIEVKNL